MMEPEPPRRQRRRRRRKPTFLEVTWNSPQDFAHATQQLRADLGCTPLDEIPHTKRHIIIIDKEEEENDDDDDDGNDNGNGNSDVGGGRDSGSDNVTTTTPSKWLNCTERIRQDLEYRQVMQYDQRTQEILFGRENNLTTIECVD
jgi:hypothetical protein